MKSKEYKIPPKRIQAKIIDLIIEFCLNYHTRYHENKPTYANIEREVRKIYKIHSRQMELLLNLMVYEEYIFAVINSESDEPVVDYYIHTDKGLSLFFKGGLTKLKNKQKNEKVLIKIAQIAAILAGIYYLIKIYEIIFLTWLN